jgi:hypothetical protein
MFGHGTRYYARKSAQPHENFANLFSLWADKTVEWKEVKALFPNLTKEFEIIMKEVNSGKLS